jgi:transcriptional regulator with XRE-family HTH domain
MAKAAKECFGDAVSSLIRKKGVTQKDVAEAVGVRQATVSRWVRKKEIPREKILDKLSEYLGVHVAMLFLPPSALYQSGSGKIILDIAEIAAESGYIIKKKDS